MAMAPTSTVSEACDNGDPTKQREEHVGSAGRAGYEPLLAGDSLLFGGKKRALRGIYAPHTCSNRSEHLLVEVD